MAQTYTADTLKITLTKSLIGRNKSHIATAQSLGLRKIGQTVEQGYFHHERDQVLESE